MGCVCMEVFDDLSSPVAMITCPKCAHGGVERLSWWAPQCVCGTEALSPIGTYRQPHNEYAV